MQLILRSEIPFKNERYSQSSFFSNNLFIKKFNSTSSELGVHGVENSEEYRNFPKIIEVTSINFRKCHFSSNAYAYER